MKKFFALSILMLGLAAGANAQVTGQADASATIITPITITWAADLLFGDIAVSATVAGTVDLDAATSVRTPAAGCTLPSTGSVFHAASFNVAGLAGASYSITLPVGALTIDDGLGNTMTVDTWESSPTPTGLLTGGAQVLYIGGLLHVAAAQVPGTYTSATPFDVIVNYN
jgi:hypothetical protein